MKFKSQDTIRVQRPNEETKAQAVVTVSFSLEETTHYLHLGVKGLN